MKRRVNRKKITVTSLDAPSDDVAYWRVQTPQARLRHMQYLRELNYGKAVATGRLKRVLEIAQRAAR